VTLFDSVYPTLEGVYGLISYFLLANQNLRNLIDS